MEKILLLGYGGHAKSVIDTIESAGQYQIAGVVDVAVSEVNYRGYNVIGCDDDLEEIYKSGIKNACVCVGYLGKGNARNRLYEKLKSIGYNLPVIIDPTAIVAKDAVIGEGTFVGKHAVINSNACVEKMCIINSGAIVEHDCKIGEFSHIAVSAVLCGEVKTGANVFIGANATAIQCVHIGDNVIAGAAATMLADVPDNRRVVGVWK